MIFVKSNNRPEEVITTVAHADEADHALEADHTLEADHALDADTADVATNADEIAVWEGGTQVGGTNRRHLNFNADTFNVTENAGTNSFDITSNAVIVLDREVTQQAVNTTTAETTVFTYTVPANIMSTNRILRFTMGFDYLMNSGTPIATLRIKFGATTLFAGNTLAFGSSSNRRPGWITLLVFNQDSAAVQAMSGLYVLNSSGLPTTGFGDISDDEMDGGGIGPVSGSATEDTTATKDFVVTVQMDVSNPVVEFRKRGAVLELL